MDVVDLESKLPAETITAVAGDAHGLTDAVRQVYVAREDRGGRSNVASPEVWWSPADTVLDDKQRLGQSTWSRTYAALFRRTVSSRGAEANASFIAWERAFRAHFHGYRRPGGVTGLDRVTVDDVIINPQASPASMAIRVTFHGEGDD